jgi:hypothetical protein
MATLEQHHMITFFQLGDKYLKAGEVIECSATGKKATVLKGGSLYKTRCTYVEVSKSDGKNYHHFIKLGTNGVFY